MEETVVVRFKEIFRLVSVMETLLGHQSAMER